VTCSTDGSLIAAVEYSSSSFDFNAGGGYIYTSEDSGQTWHKETQLGQRFWKTVTTSGNGTHIASGVFDGYIYTATYCPCPEGTFSLYEDQSFCESCPVGSFNDLPGSLTCEYCSYPYTTLIDGSSACESLSVGLGIDYVIVIGVIFGCIFLTGLVAAGGKRRIMLCFTLMVIPALDFVLDILYILSVDFYNKSLFDACVSVLILSLTFQLYRFLVRKKGTPFSYLHFKYPLRFNVFWLSFDRAWNAFYIKPDGTLEATNATGGKYFQLLFAQFGYVIIYAVWYILLALPYTPWLLVGAILLQFKVLSLGPVWNGWFYVYTGGHKYDIDDYIDVVVLNKSIQDQFVIGSSQQWIIQVNKI
jgi:hypothetical protein